MTRRQTKYTNQYSGSLEGQQGDQFRPLSRARLTHLPPMEDNQMPHHKGPCRPKMDRPRVRTSNSGNSIMNEIQHAHEPHAHGGRLTDQRNPRDAALHLPHIDSKGAGQWAPRKQLPKIEEAMTQEAMDNKSFQRPSLMGKVPTPPEAPKVGIPSVKTFAHSHMNGASTQAPGRRFKPMMHAHQVVVTGRQPVPPPPRPTGHVPAAPKTNRVPSPEARVSDHMISATQEKIILSPTDLRMLSPASTESRHGGSHTAINHEIIRSPSSLVDVTNTTHAVPNKRKSPPTLIDVNLQPAAHSNASSTGTVDKRNKKRRGSRC